jgi:glycosyltransferase involved in cell wall biosynthesis
MDKTIFTSVAKNIIVHSNSGKDALENLGHTNNLIRVIPHGCVEFNDVKELWNTFQTPYAIVQFGFGFFYKGVDRAIEAVGILKNKFPEKYKDIFYCYLCSESANAVGTHAEYQNYLESIIEKFNLYDNIAIIRKYNSDEIINNYLRTAKLALFPYVTNPNNIVYGASGAVRVAMANQIPVITSESNMFDDLNNVVPRPNNAEELSKEIDKIFSDHNYKNNLISLNNKYIQENIWEKTADRYLDFIKDVLKKENFIEIV